MRMTTWLAMGLLALGAMACGDDVQGGEGGAGQGGDGAAGGQGGAAATGGAGADGGSGGQGGGQGGGSGAVCGGIGGEACPLGEYCDFQPSTCGFDDGIGTCVVVPDGGCPENYFPTCGCDGKVYGNGCEAAVAGVDIDLTGSCEPPQANLFPCGANFCDLATHYCEVQTSDIGGMDDSFACVALPNGCGDTPDCACLAGESCGFNCAGDAQEGLTLTCPGG